MNVTWTWLDFFLRRYMFPFYAMFFIFVGLSIENRAKRKRAQRIINKAVSSLQVISVGITDFTSKEMLSDILLGLTNIGGYRNSDLLEITDENLNFRTGELSDIIFNNKKILKKIILNHNLGNNRYQIKIPGGVIFMQNVSKNIILAVKVANAPFPSLEIFRWKY
jgi:hypothetical protein